MYDQTDKHIYHQDGEGTFYGSGYFWDSQTGRIEVKPKEIAQGTVVLKDLKGEDYAKFSGMVVIMNREELQAKLKAQAEADAKAMPLSMPVQMQAPTKSAQNMSAPSQVQTIQNNTKNSPSMASDEKLINTGNQALKTLSVTLTLDATDAAIAGTNQVIIGDATENIALLNSIPALEAPFVIGGTYDGNTLKVLNNILRYQGSVQITNWVETANNAGAFNAPATGGAALSLAKFTLGLDQVQSTTQNYNSNISSESLNLTVRNFGSRFQPIITSTAAIIRRVAKGITTTIQFDISYMETVQILSSAGAAI